MCRANSHPLGGYRCMPSNAFLQASSGIITTKDDGYVRGAFWIPPDQRNDIPTIDDIRYQIDKMNGLYRSGASYEMLTDELIHIGYMVTSLSDSKVNDLDIRLSDIQKSAVEYERTLINSSDTLEVNKASEKLTNKSLALSYDMRISLAETLSEVRDFGIPLGVKIKGNSKLRLLIKKNSVLFPSQWNEELLRQKVLKVKFINDSKKNSSYSFYDKLMTISKGTDGFFAAKSLDEAKKDMESLDFVTRHEIAHESSHMYESTSPIIKNTTYALLLARITSKDGFINNYDRFTVRDNQQKITQGIGRDHFSNLIMGQYYANSKSNEIFSRGVESVLLGTNGSFLGLSMALPNESISHYVPDIETRSLVVGILSAVDL